MQVLKNEHTSLPALVSPLTVCSSMRLPFMFRYFTFLKTGTFGVCLQIDSHEGDARYKL